MRCQRAVSTQIDRMYRTLNEAEYGMPMGRFAKIASMRLAKGDLKARL